MDFSAPLAPKQSWDDGYQTAGLESCSQLKGEQTAAQTAAERVHRGTRIQAPAFAVGRYQGNPRSPSGCQESI